MLVLLFSLLMAKPASALTCGERLLALRHGWPAGTQVQRPYMYSDTDLLLESAAGNQTVGLWTAFTHTGSVIVESQTVYGNYLGFAGEDVWQAFAGMWNRIRNVDRVDTLVFTSARAPGEDLSLVPITSRFSPTTIETNRRIGVIFARDPQLRRVNFEAHLVYLGAFRPRKVGYMVRRGDPSAN